MPRQRSSDSSHSTSLSPNFVFRLRNAILLSRYPFQCTSHTANLSTIHRPPPCSVYIITSLDPFRFRRSQKQRTSSNTVVGLWVRGAVVGCCVLPKRLSANCRYELVRRCSPTPTCPHEPTPKCCNSSVEGSPTTNYLLPPHSSRQAMTFNIQCSVVRDDNGKENIPKGSETRWRCFGGAIDRVANVCHQSI